MYRSGDFGAVGSAERQRRCLPTPRWRWRLILRRSRVVNGAAAFKHPVVVAGDGCDPCLGPRVRGPDQLAFLKMLLDTNRGIRSGADGRLCTRLILLV
jgi:hypothetical protein